MSCGCKRVMNFEKENGVELKESIFTKILRIFYKIFLFMLFVSLAVIVTPCVILAAIYTMIFGKGVLVLPEFMRKYLF